MIKELQDKPESPLAFIKTARNKINEIIRYFNNQPKTWEGLLTQTSTNAPTAIVGNNDLGGTITWSYVSAGTYRGTLSGAFTADKTYIYVGGFDLGAIINSYRINANVIEVSTCYNDGIGDNDILNKTSLLIKVYA